MSLYRFHSLTPAEQLVALTAVLDPVGLAGGYLLGRDVGLDPVVGAAVGVAITSTITILWFALGRT